MRVLIGEISTFQAGFLVGLTIGIVEVIKRLFPDWTWSRVGPIFSIVVGLCLGLGVHLSDDGWNGGPFEAVVVGLAIGLSATGLYDGVDRLVHLKKDRGDDGKRSYSRRPGARVGRR